MFLLGLCRDQSAIDHIRSLFDYFEKGKYYRLYAFNVSQGRYEYLNGEIRRYVPKDQRN